MTTVNQKDFDASTKHSVFDKLGVKPVINASGIYTDLGGSILSDELWSDLTELNGAYIDIIELLDKTGDTIADLVGTEAARITPGASAGIALAVGAVMTGNHGPNWEQLPDTAGMRNEIILQRPQAINYQYLNPVRISGATVVLAGNDHTTTIDDLHAAVNENTAAIFIPAHLDVMENIVKMKELRAFADQHGIKFLIDAAYQIFPAKRMCDFAALGADLTMISSKYFFGPSAGGFLSGSKEMIDVVTGLDFTKFESGEFRTFGRPFKMGRYEIASVCLALQAWFERDHDARWQGYADKANSVAEAVNAIDGLMARACCFTFDETIEKTPVNAAMISVNHPSLTADDLVAQLRAGNPGIYPVPFDGTVLIVTETLRDGDDVIISERIAEITKAATS